MRVKLLVALVFGLMAAPELAAQTVTIEYYHTDAIGSVRAVTDAGGNVVRRYDYFPFGEDNGSAGPDSGRFAGKERDAETFLNYFGARYYASRSGRMTTVDPVMLIERNLADPQSWNRYSHVKNNPLRHIDRDGRVWETLWDVGNLVYSAYKCTTGQGCTNLGIDAVATLIPFVPAGTTRVIRLADDAVDAAKKSDEFIDLARPSRRQHILDGDKTGGGHRAGTGNPGKSEFPAGWSDDQVMHHISEVATDPKASRTAGRGGRTVVEGTREGITIRVILERDGSNRNCLSYERNQKSEVTAMRGTDFADIERGFYTALDHLADVISSSQREEVNGLIEVGEYGVALEALCAILVEEGIDVRNKDLRQLTNLADAMGIRNTSTDRLAKAADLPAEGDHS